MNMNKEVQEHRKEQAGFAGDDDFVRVIKIDNQTSLDQTQLKHCCEYIAQRSAAGEQVIVVHGGNEELLHWFGKFYGIDGRKTGLPLLSENNMELVSMVLCGSVNQKIVMELRQAGVNALGLSGCDAGILSSNFLNKRHLGRVGGPPRVDIAPVRRLLGSGFVLVLSSVCPAADGGMLLLDEEVAAQAIATALEADHFDFITSVDALDAVETEENTLRVSQLRTLLSDALAGTELVPKLQAAMSALHDGVQRVHIGSVEQLSQEQAYAIER